MDHSSFKESDWSEVYRDDKDAITVNAPEPQGREVDSCMFLDSDHEGDKVSHRSTSGILIYINTALVQWFSKNQSTVETSVFGTEFVTMKQYRFPAMLKIHEDDVYSYICSIIYLWEQYVSYT